jgi:hypothetical protein
MKSKIARMAIFFAIDYALSAAPSAGLLMVYSGV